MGRRGGFAARGGATAMSDDIFTSSGDLGDAYLHLRVERRGFAA